jgi:hypothetical protein
MFWQNGCQGVFFLKALKISPKHGVFWETAKQCLDSL